MEDFTFITGRPLPSPEAIARRPEVYRQEKYEAKRGEIQHKITELQTELEGLQASLENPATYERVPFLETLDPETREQLEARRNEREEKAKTAVSSLLADVNLCDDEAATAHYTTKVDHDLAGGYIEYHSVFLAKQVGVYLVSHQVSFGESVGAKRDYLTPHYRQYLLHTDAPQPLTSSNKGMLDDLGEVTLATTTPIDWEFVERDVQANTETIRTKRLADRLIPLLDQKDLHPKVSRNGYVDPSQLTNSYSIELAAGVAIRVNGTYYQELRGRVPTIVLKSVKIGIFHGEEAAEAYVIDIPTLEVLPREYDSYENVGNKHLHSKAETLANILFENIANNSKAG